MPEQKPYTHVRLILDKSDALNRYEIRVSHYVEFDENPGRRAINKKPSKKAALEIAKEIARREKARSRIVQVMPGFVAFVVCSGVILW